MVRWHSRAMWSVLVAWLIAASGCNRGERSGPPEIRLGDSVCAECGMIVSDERYGTATIIQGDRGPEAAIFDDFNCQMNFEAEHGDDLVIVRRWSRDFRTLEWFNTLDGWFVESQKIHTPMASHVAAHASEEEAREHAAQVSGTVRPIGEVWNTP